jgi:hypothetical protein
MDKDHVANDLKYFNKFSTHCDESQWNQDSKPEIQLFLDVTYTGLVDPEGEGTVRDYTPSDTASHPRGNESSITPLREPQISYYKLHQQDQPM